MIAVDETTGRARALLVDADGKLIINATLSAGNITIDNADVEAKLDTLIAMQYDQTDAPWRYAAASGGIVSSTTPIVLKAAEPGKQHYLTGLQLTHIGGTGQHEVEILSGATVIWRGAVNLQDNVPFASGGIFPPLIGGVNENLEFKMVTSDPGNVYVNAQGFTL